jgi:hypothetical protein
VKKVSGCAGVPGLEQLPGIWKQIPGLLQISSLKSVLDHTKKRMPESIRPIIYFAISTDIFD